MYIYIYICVYICIGLTRVRQNQTHAATHNICGLWVKPYGSMVLVLPIYRVC